MCLFLEEEEQDEDMTYLTKSLSNIKDMILKANRSGKLKKHKIEETVRF